MAHRPPMEAESPPRTVFTCPLAGGAELALNDLLHRDAKDAGDAKGQERRRGHGSHRAAESGYLTPTGARNLAQHQEAA